MICFAFVAGTLVFTYFLVGGTRNSFDVGISRMGADLMVVPQGEGSQGETVILTGKPSTFFFNSSIVDQVRAIEGVDAASSQIYIATLKDAPCCSMPVQLIGFDPSTDFTISPWLNRELGRQLAPNEVIVGSRIIGDIGSNLKFYGHNFTIAARLEPTGMGTDVSVFIRADDAYTMAEQSAAVGATPLSLQRGQISAVLVRVEKSTDPSAVASKIQAQISGTQVVTSNALIERVMTQLSSASELLYVTTAAVAVVSIPLVAVVSTMAASERRREIGLLRAMGANKAFVFRVIFSEGVFLAVVGGLAGVVGSVVILYSFERLITTALAVPFLWPPITETLSYVGLTLTVATAAGSLACLYPAFMSSRLEPYEAIRRGET